MFILHRVCENMQCTINRASSFLFLDFDLKHLKWQVPSQVDVVFVLVHPDFCYPQGISLHGHAQVRHVGLVVPLNVGDLGARNHFNTASTCPHLYDGGKKKKKTLYDNCASANLPGYTSRHSRKSLLSQESSNAKSTTSRC